MAVIDEFVLTGAVKAIYQSNEGQYSAYNAGFAASSGDIVMFLDADDMYLPESARVVVAAMNAGTAKAHFRLRLTGPVDPDDPVAVHAALALVMRDYQPGHYDGDVLLLRAEPPGSSATVDYRTDDWNGWRHVAPKLEVATLPCRHEDILRDHASLTKTRREATPRQEIP